MYTLYYAPYAIAMAPQALLEEIGAPFELRLVDVYSGNPPDWYRRLNPYNRVPTLVIDGEPVFEAAAICLHLCDRHPEAGLAPPPGSIERARLYQWLSFLASALHPATKQINYPARMSADPTDAPAVLAAGAEACAGLYRVAEEALAAGPYLLGERFSPADYYLATLLCWRPSLEAKSGRSFGPLPRLDDHLARMTARPAFGKVRAHHEALRAKTATAS